MLGALEELEELEAGGSAGAVVLVWDDKQEVFFPANTVNGGICPTTPKLSWTAFIPNVPGGIATVQLKPIANTEIVEFSS